MKHPSPFPVDTLPEPAARLVAEGADAIGVDPGMIGPCVLAAMAAAIGNARTIELQPGWREPSVLWVGVVAPSGSAKSPVLELATRPLERRDGENHRAYIRAMSEYQARDGAEPVANERPDFPPDLPTGPPRCERMVTSDATYEGVIKLFESSPRGILFAADELAAWLGGFTRYSNGGRKGGEEARWLPMHRAGPAKLDRSGKPPIRAERAALSVCGMIQPGILAATLTGTDFANGLVARLLLAMPPIPRRRWRPDAGLDPATEARYAAMINRLLSLPVCPDAEPPASTLDPEAKPVWGAHFEAINAEIALAEERGRSMMSKLEGGAARLALGIHLGRWASGEQVDPTRVDGESMRRGVRLAEWFAGEAERVYAMIDGDKAKQADEELLDMIHRNDGSISVRELQRARPKRYPTSEAATDALDALMNDGYLRRDHPKPSERGGRSEKRCVLVDRTPEHASELGFCQMSTGVENWPATGQGGD